MLKKSENNATEQIGLVTPTPNFIWELITSLDLLSSVKLKLHQFLVKIKYAWVFYFMENNPTVWNICLDTFD